MDVAMAVALKANESNMLLQAQLIQNTKMKSLCNNGFVASMFADRMQILFSRMWFACNCPIFMFR
jgi:hypothetical protein